jgi:hypothetical protein
MSATQCEGDAIATEDRREPEAKKRTRRRKVGSVDTKAKPLGVRLPASMAKRIEAWQVRSGEGNVAQALRYMVQAGLDTNPGPREVGRLPRLEPGTEAGNYHFSEEMLAKLGTLSAKLGGTLSRHRSILICIQIGLAVAEAALENKQDGGDE